MQIKKLVLLLFFSLPLSACFTKSSSTTAAPSSAAVVVTPDKISGLQLWMNADTAVASGSDTNDLTSLTEPTISSWVDSSTNGILFTQATALARPFLKTNAINGHAAIEFDLSNRFLDAGNVMGSVFAGSTAKYTTLIVANGAGSGSDGQTQGAILSKGWVAFSVDDSNTNPAITRLMYQSGSSANSDSNIFVASGSGVFFQTFGLAAWTVDMTKGSPLTMFGNGTSQSNTVSFTGNGISPVTDSQFPNLQIGTALGATNYFTGIISEIIVYDRVLTSAELVTVSAYITNKYALPVGGGF